MRTTAGLAGSREKAQKMSVSENRHPGRSLPLRGSTLGLDWHRERRIRAVWGVWQPQVSRKCRGGGARGHKGLEAGRSLNSFCLPGCCLL